MVVSQRSFSDQNFVKKPKTHSVFKLIILTNNDVDTVLHSLNK